MVEILLSTYNGEDYIPALLDSILNQTFSSWILSIRDDGSSDQTLRILESYQLRFPERLKIIDSSGVNLGSTRSFSALIEQSQEAYVMLCDQDDVWLPTKIEESFNALKGVEKESPGKPCLVFTDLQIVDENLSVIANSFMANQKLSPLLVNDFIKVAALNIVAGCTIIMNRLATRIVAPIPSPEIVHDQWIAVLVAYHGRISYYERPTILYRQHSNNVVGSNQIGVMYFLKKIFFPMKQIVVYHRLLSTMPIPIPVLKFFYYKLFFSVRRILNR